MDSTPEDDVQVISRMLSMLQSVLTERGEISQKLEVESKGLAKKLDIPYSTADKDIASDGNKLGPLVTHDISKVKEIYPAKYTEIEDIHKENIRLLLALQRQDFVRNGYEKLLGEYQDLLDSINSSIMNRKNYVSVKAYNDELQFKEKCANLENQIRLCSVENKKYDMIYDDKLGALKQNIIALQRQLDKESSATGTIKNLEDEALSRKLDILQKVMEETVNK